MAWKEREKEHKQFMDDSNRRMQSSMQALRAECSKEFESLIDEKLRTQKQAAQLEAETKQLRMELKLEKDLQKQRTEAVLNEALETNRQIDQEKDAHVRELEVMLKKKEKELEGVQAEFEILDDGVQPMLETINALQTKVDALYCIAYATVPKQHQDSLQPLSMRGIDLMKRDGVTQVVDYTCSLLAGMPASHACEAATALGMAGRNDLKHKELLQKIREALSGTGPASSR